MAAQLDSERSKKLQDAIHAKVVELGWSSSNDTVLSDYIIVMLGNKKTPSEVAVELSETLGSSDVDSQFVSWLTRTVQEHSSQGTAPGSSKAQSSMPAVSSPAPATAAAPSQPSRELDDTTDGERLREGEVEEDVRAPPPPPTQKQRSSGQDNSRGNGLRNSFGNQGGGRKRDSDAVSDGNDRSARHKTRHDGPPLSGGVPTGPRNQNQGSKSIFERAGVRPNPMARGNVNRFVTDNDPSQQHMRQQMQNMMSGMPNMGMPMMPQGMPNQRGMPPNQGMPNQGMPNQGMLPFMNAAPFGMPFMPHGSKGGSPHNQNQPGGPQPQQFFPPPGFLPPQQQQQQQQQPHMQNQGHFAAGPNFNHSMPSNVPTTMGRKQGFVRGSQNPLPKAPLDDSICKYATECGQPHCKYMHPSPVATKESGLVLSSERCEKQLTCDDKDCPKGHVSPAQKKVLGDKISAPAPEALEHATRPSNARGIGVPNMAPSSGGQAAAPIKPAAPQADAQPAMPQSPATASPQNAAAIPANAASTPCRFGNVCQRPNCAYMHPWDKSYIPCRFGAACTRPDCYFSHPPRRPTGKNASVVFNADGTPKKVEGAEEGKEKTNGANGTDMSDRLEKFAKESAGEEGREKIIPGSGE